MQPLEDMSSFDLALSGSVGFSYDRVAQASEFDLIGKELVNFFFLEQGHDLWNRHSCLLCSESEALGGKVQQLSLRHWFDFNLQLVPRAKLVLDVLDTAEALEDTAFYHNAHL